MPWEKKVYYSPFWGGMQHFPEEMPAISSFLRILERAETLPPRPCPMFLDGVTFGFGFKAKHGLDPTIQIRSVNSNVMMLAVPVCGVIIDFR